MSCGVPRPSMDIWCYSVSIHPAQTPSGSIMVKHKGGAGKSQTWLTFLRNHLEVSGAMDFFTVPTLRFQILHIFVILNHSRRQVVHFAVTASGITQNRPVRVTSNPDNGKGSGH